MLIFTIYLKNGLKIKTTSTNDNNMTLFNSVEFVWRQGF